MKHRIISLLFFIISIQVVPGRPPSSIEEALQCVFFVSGYDRHNNHTQSGSAFLVEENGVQWIYTNAHVIDGAAKIEIRDSDQQLIRDFGKFGCYSTKAGTIEAVAEGDGKDGPKIRLGGDGVRLALKKKRSLAFIMHNQPGKLSKGSPVTTLGDNDGDKSMEVLDGKILNLTPKAILTSCATRPGSSGGALIERDTFKVIGLNTWGFRSDVKPIDALWGERNPQTQNEKDPEEEPPAEDEGRQGSPWQAVASIISAASWTELPAAEFMKGSKYMRDYIDSVLILTLIYSLTPTETGFEVDLNSYIGARVRYSEAFKRYLSNPIMRPVIALNQSLGRSKHTRFRKSNNELVSTYAKAIRRSRELYFEQTKILKGKMAPYYRIHLESLGADTLGNYCYEKLDTAEKWFVDKASVGGVLPVGRWFDLPPLSDFTIE